jgi:chemotaxis protein CheD
MPVRPRAQLPVPPQAPRDAERFLMPGQLDFGRAPMRLRTLLGSCVAVTLWHPHKRVGGMCHFLLPSRKRAGHEPLDGRYGDEALQWMQDALRRMGTRPEEYVAHLYGGADTLPEGSGVKLNIGERNIEQGWSLIDHHGFQLENVDVGDNIPRTVALDLASGQVDMRRGMRR